MELYKSDTLTIEVDKDNSILFYQWNNKSAYLSQDEFLRESQIIYNEILKNKVNNVLGDDRNFLYPIAPEVQESVGKQLLEGLNKVNLKKIAQVQSRDFIAQLSVEQLFEENQNASYIHKYFDDIDQAKAWLIYF